MSTPSYRESHLDKGIEYHESFSSMSHRAMVWRLEQRLVQRIVRKTFENRAPRHLDFACGTGRFLELLASTAASSTGVDVSESMLQVARDRLGDVELVVSDITREDRLGSRQFDLITAFRFFPNAESDLRRDAIAALSGHLAPGGILILNNHMNRNSLVRRAVVALGRTTSESKQHSDWGMSREEVVQMVTGAGLSVVREFPLGVLPLTDRHMLYPAVVLELTELAMTNLRIFKNLAQNLVFVCRHDDQSIAAGSHD